MDSSPLSKTIFKQGFFNANQMKYLMAFLMVFDHLDIIPGLLTASQAAWLHILTRMVAPWFMFAAVESFIYTRNRLRYLFRLIVAALVMSYGSRLLNAWIFSEANQVTNNIFLSLALGVLCLILLYPDRPRLKRELLEVVPNLNLERWARVPNWALSLAAIPLLILVTPQIEGAFLVPLMMVGLYIARNSIKSLSLVLIGFSLLFFGLSYADYGLDFFTWPNFGFSAQWFMFAAIPFLYLYNGKAGSKSRFAHYFLYVFYPAHLWILHLIAESML